MCIFIYIYIYIHVCIYILYYIYIFSICLQKLRWPLVLPFFGTHMGGRTSPQNCQRVQVMSCNPALLNACGGQFFFLCHWGMGACVLHIVSKSNLLDDSDPGSHPSVLFVVWINQVWSLLLVVEVQDFFILAPAAVVSY